jgi:hypothetical protein
VRARQGRAIQGRRSVTGVRVGIRGCPTEVRLGRTLAPAATTTLPPAPATSELVRHAAAGDRRGGFELWQRWTSSEWPTSVEEERDGGDGRLRRKEVLGRLNEEYVREAWCGSSTSPSRSH